MARLGITLVLIAASLSTAYAAENELAVVAGLDFGFKRLHLDVGKDTKGEGGGSFNPSYVTINPNIAFGFSSFYASLSHDKSISAEPGTGMDGNSGSVIDFSRTDTTLTLGHRLDQSFSVFAGYTRGSNNFTETGFGNGALKVKDITYTETGPFAGVAFTKGFGDKGTLAASVGYAKLDGELKFVNHGGNDPDQVATGDNTGLSYGLTWSGPLTGSLGYRVGLKGTRYEMDAGPDNPQDISEKYTTFFFGIVNYF